MTRPEEPSLFDPPYGDAPTSRGAARQIKARSPGMRDAVLRFIRRQGLAGAIDEEVQTALGIKCQTETPRRCELARAGLIYNSGRTRPTSSGRPAAVWVASALNNPEVP